MLVGKGTSGEPSRTGMDRSTLSKRETGQLANPGFCRKVPGMALAGNCQSGRGSARGGLPLYRGLAGMVQEQVPLMGQRVES
jgi:hypothetical protein